MKREVCRHEKHPRNFKRFSVNNKTLFFNPRMEQFQQLFYNKLLLHSTSGSLLELEKWLQLCVSVCYSKHKHPRNQKRPIFELLENWFLRFSLILKVTSFGLQNNDQMSADILIGNGGWPRLAIGPTPNRLVADGNPDVKLLSTRRTGAQFLSRFGNLDFVKSNLWYEFLAMVRVMALGLRSKRFFCF